MMRLIDADALIKDAMKSPNYFIIKYAVQKAPTIDAVQVIRYKDCKWFNRFGCAVEIVDFTDKPTENDYCSFGERKDDDGQR